MTDTATQSVIKSLLDSARSLKSSCGVATGLPVGVVRNFYSCSFSNAEGTQTALERVRVSLARLTFATDRTTIKFTVSIGFTRARSGDQPQASVERADQALYLAKQAGRNRVRFYELEAA